MPVIAPALFLPRSARPSAAGGAPHARPEFALDLSRLPHLVWVPVDMVLALQAAEVAAGQQLRGADAVYVAAALRFGSTLDTWTGGAGAGGRRRPGRPGSDCGVGRRLRFRGIAGKG